METDCAQDDDDDEEEEEEEAEEEEEEGDDARYSPHKTPRRRDPPPRALRPRHHAEGLAPTDSDRKRAHQLRDALSKCCGQNANVMATTVSAFLDTRLVRSLRVPQLELKIGHDHDVEKEIGEAVVQFFERHTSESKGGTVDQVKREIMEAALMAAIPDAAHRA
jgi:hypothetical protein